jgi:hypothetical protein
MSYVASYNITNITGALGKISIERVNLRQGETAGIVFISPAVQQAIDEGLISIAPTLSPEETVTNITAYINSLESLPVVVNALPAGTVYVEPEPEPE